MLNAFRHQRFDTNSSIRKVFNNFVCSTPFGIRDSTQTSPSPYRIKATVLNAFRHQRFDTARNGRKFLIFVGCSTPFGIRDSTLDPFSCLRANQMCSTPFGIRDSTHWKIANRIYQTGMKCSTPFGIRDSTLLHSRRDRLDFIVLNAFRHQRFDTILYLDYLSTSMSAQRLSASEIRHIFTYQIF